MKKPHFRLHFTMFDGMTPLWWVTRIRWVAGISQRCTTGGFRDAATAILDARIRFS